MGFWHTGYMEFHEPSGESGFREREPALPVYPCPRCALEFSTERDLRVHAFAGHATPRPTLVFMGRECGRTRLTVTRETSPADWVMRNAESVEINGRRYSPGDAAAFLSAQRSGVSSVVLSNGGVRQEFEFEFSLAGEEDLHGVDTALAHLIEGGVLELRTIDDFIMRSESYPTARRYMSGLANYLYGVLARQGAAEPGDAEGIARADYQGKYDKAVAILGAFDRPPAEAICGIVAFHHNQFDHAMRKTKSGRVAEVSLRFEEILTGVPWRPDDLSRSPRSSLDFALSDIVIEQVLEWSAIPLDGTAKAQVAEMTASLEGQRAYDTLKLNLVAAEHFLAAGDRQAAVRYANTLRHSTLANHWYANFRTRVQGASVQ